MKLFSNNSFFQIALAGILIGISYHPLNLGWLSWIGFIPLIIVFCRGDYLHNIWYGYLFGIVYNSIAFYWIGNNSGASFGVVISSFIAAILYLSIFWALAGGIFSFISFNNRKILGVFSFPFLIVSIEWIRSFGPLGFSIFLLLKEIKEKIPPAKAQKNDKYRMAAIKLEITTPKLAPELFPIQ